MKTKSISFCTIKCEAAEIHICSPLNTSFFNFFKRRWDLINEYYLIEQVVPNMEVQKIKKNRKERSNFNELPSLLDLSEFPSW